MKKRLCFLLMICLVIFVLTCGLAAAGKTAPAVSGIYNVTAKISAVSLVPGGTASTAYDGYGTFYEGAEFVNLTYTGASAGSYYLLITTENELHGVPTVSDEIFYIDQVTADTSGNVSFKVYPKALNAGETYYTYMISNGTGAGDLTVLTKVAEFNYYEPVPAADPEVANYTKDTVNNDSATVEFENGGTTAVVSCSKACAVLAKTGDDAYTRLTPVQRSENVYAFDLTGLPEGFELVVALRADANLDGYINSTDLGQARGVMSKKLVPDRLKELVMDLKVDDMYNSTDLGQLRAVMSGKLILGWEIK